MDLAVNGTSQIEKYCFLATSYVGNPKKKTSSEGTKKKCWANRAMSPAAMSLCFSSIVPSTSK